MMNIRRKFAEKMRRWADRIGPEDAFVGGSFSFYFLHGSGLRFDTEGLKGVKCWYRRSDYDERRFGDPQVAQTLRNMETIIHGKPITRDPWEKDR